MKHIAALPARRAPSLLSCLFVLCNLFAGANGYLLSQQASSLPDDRLALLSALGFSNQPPEQPTHSAYSVQGTLYDANGLQYATLRLISRDLSEMRQEFAGAQTHVLIVNHGQGSESTDSGPVKRLTATEAMKPFHLLPTPEVLQLLTQTSRVKQLTTDASNSCSIFSLVASERWSGNIPTQAFSMCINTANHHVIYEEEPFSFTATGSSHKLRRTFTWSADSSSSTPLLVMVSLDNQISYSIQITNFNSAPSIATDTFHVLKESR